MRINEGLSKGETPEVIAQSLFRTPEQILKYIITKSKKFAPEKEEEKKAIVIKGATSFDLDGEAYGPKKIINDLHSSPIWRMLKEQYNNIELRFYEEQYTSFMSQFGEDITPSERVQVHKAVQYEIIMNRNKVDQRKLKESIEDWEESIKKINRLHEDEDDVGERVRNKIGALTDNITLARNELKGCLKTHTELDSKHQDLLEDLKSTRKQRLEKNDRRVSFTDLIRAVISEKNREAEGRRAELMRQASNRTREELSEIHEYIDGSFDAPLMNADNVGAIHIPEVIVHGEEKKGS